MLSLPKVLKEMESHYVDWVIQFKKEIAASGNMAEMLDDKVINDLYDIGLDVSEAIEEYQLRVGV